MSVLTIQNFLLNAYVMLFKDEFAYFETEFLDACLKLDLT